MAERTTPERRAAHERLSTGGFARWTRACATHPWRVVLAWVGIIAAPDRPRRHRRRQPPGRVRDPRLGHPAGDRPDRGGVRLGAGRRPQRRLRRPEGERLDTPERKAAIEERDRAAASRTSSSRPRTRPGSRASATRSTRTRFSDDGRIAYAEAQFDRVIFDEDREAVVAVQDAVREAVEPAGVTVEYNGEAEFPPIEQGTSELLGLLAAIIVLLDRLPHVRRDVHPDRARDRRAGDGVPARCSSSPA